MSVRPLARWKEAATLILVAKNNMPRCRFDYRILMLKRSSNSKFMPNMYVFPGGIIDRMDFSNQWMDLYSASFQKVGKDFSSLLNIKGPRPPIFHKSDSAIPSEVAFRICAIRETFEESGILLLKDLSDSQKTASDVARKLTANELLEWQKLVHSDATNFLLMCRKLGCVPDVWSLGEWSNWLTPPDLHRRFDTAFFTSFIEEEPNVEYCEKEMVKSQWVTPAEALTEFLKGKGNIGPPQIMELLKFCQFEKWSQFCTFQERRKSQGLDQILTVRVQCTDAVVNILPQDDMHATVLKQYLKRDDRTVPRYPVTAEEFRKGSSNLYRIEMKKDTKLPVLLCNVSLPHGQCTPVTDPHRILELAAKTQSKL